MLILAVALLLPSGSIDEQASLTPLELGEASPLAMSEDGAVIVGSTGLPWNRQPFIWSAGKTLFDPETSKSHTYGQSAAVSADGSTVVGEAYAPHQDRTAFRWTKAEGMQTLGTLPGGDSSHAWGVSADGSVVVGESNNAPGGSHFAFRWTKKDGMKSLGAPKGLTFSWASAVSADGSVIVGWTGDGKPWGARPFRWTAATGFTLLSNSHGTATGISADGTVVIGSSGIGNSGKGLGAFKWTTQTSYEDLGILQQGNTYPAAVSADGSVIVGTSGATAFLWTKKTGMRPLEEVLRATGLSKDLEDRKLGNALDVAVSNGVATVLVSCSKGYCLARFRVP